MTPTTDRLVDRLTRELKAFLDDPSRQVQWIGDGKAQIYVRKSRRYLDDYFGLQPVLDIANVSIHPRVQGRGIFTKFLDVAIDLIEHMYSDEETVYIEQVLNERLNSRLQRDPRFKGVFSSPGFRDPMSFYYVWPEHREASPAVA